jgi:phenylacetate-CoA ligase
MERFRKGEIPGSIKSLSELPEMPFTTKDDMRRSYPFGFLAAPKSKIARYGESTGTTGSPTSSFMTRADWERANVWVTLSLLSHFSKDDTIFVAIPYELAFAAQDIDQAFSNIGSTVVSVGSMNSVCPWDRVIEMMKALHPTVLVCTPTRALRLYDMLLDKDFDPAKVGLKTLFYTGETCSFAKLAKIAGLWNVNILTAYGTTETNSLSLPCEHGKQHLTEDRYLFEVIDPVTEKPIMGGEGRGELVITSLYLEAMPLIRYRTGDIVSVHTERCRCGSPFRSFHHYGRYNERIELRGRSILKFDLEETVLSDNNIGCYYGASVEPDGRLYILVQPAGVNNDHALESVREKVMKEHKVDALVQLVDKTLFCKAMDGMLKPGSVTLSQIKKAARQ